MQQLKEKMFVKMLPVEKANNYDMICLINKQLYIGTALKGTHSTKECQYQHLYIISNKEIKEGDWFISANMLIKAEGKLWKYATRTKSKVEASTDKSLGLPLIPEGFVRKYIEKQGKIDEVMVDMVIEHDLRTLDKEKEFNQVVKTDKNNYITITKVKDSFSREEVVELIEKAVAESHDYSKKNNDVHSIGIIKKNFLNKWIEENL